MLQYGKLTAEAKKLHAEVEKLSDTAQEMAVSVAGQAELVVNVIAFVILAIICVILVTIFRSINSPIQELKKIAENFSRGDFSVLMDDSRSDEFGMVSSDFNRATRKLNAILSHVKEISGLLSLKSEKVSSSAVEIAGNAQEQSSQTARAVKVLEDLTASFTSVASNTTYTANSAKEAADLSLQSADVITGTVQGMNNIARYVNDSTVNIEALDSGSKQIGEIVISDIESISRIAGQTAKRAQESSEATHDMNVLVQKLHNFISEFTLRDGTAEVDENGEASGEGMRTDVSDRAVTVGDGQNDQAAPAEQQSPQDQPQ